MVTNNEQNQYTYAATTDSEDFILEVFPSFGLIPSNQRR